jgi:UDP-N-acetylglucosamine 2-epimerase (non-hydrolysing)
MYKNMIIDVIAGARPNFIKISALFSITSDFPSLHLRFVHTGQHYDAAMSDVFLQELGLPEPACHLNAGSGSHATQTGEIMKRYEAWVQANRPDLCVVVGDVNSTLACALVAAKEQITVAHVEAGLRSFDRAMPEEINRMATDCISDLLFVSEPSGVTNLAREGRPSDAIHLVGNVMVDTLFRLRDRASELRQHQNYGVKQGEYAYVTVHRPSNVDTSTDLSEICDQLMWLASQIDVVFPVHPRTHDKLKQFGLLEQLDQTNGMQLTEPTGYLASISLAMHAKLVVTDSGGLQEETTALNVPCLTLRENTERPVTLTEGTNTLIRRNSGLFRDVVTEILQNRANHAEKQVPYWDGQAGRKILEIIRATRDI